jgi:hypothetical protein
MGPIQEGGGAFLEVVDEEEEKDRFSHISEDSTMSQVGAEHSTLSQVGAEDSRDSTGGC